jgi:hypothetical protein
LRVNDLRQRGSKTLGNLQSADKSELRGSRKTVATAVLLLILATPSLWLIAAVPPLWRDVDAYVQTVSPLSAGTILKHGPLYCIFSRVPLWLGYLASGAGPWVWLGHFIKHTQLTNAGVFTLVLAQHVALWWAALFFINVITANLLWRLLLAIFFASHPLFYAFAHCVGSETLSMIIIILVAASELRIVFRYPNIVPRDWILFGVLLCAAILTRHINSVLVALLPITIFLIAFMQFLQKPLADRQASSAANFTLRRSAYIWCVSVITGLSALVLATSFTHLLCWRAHISWRSTFGVTFVWRLNFLNRLPLGTRDQLLAATASKCRLAETRQLLVKLGEWFGQNRPWDPEAFAKESRVSFFAPSGNVDFEKFNRSLNEMAYALLIPPNSALSSAALEDFQYATRLSETDVVQYLFVTTDYFFNHRASMPQLARLKTFREPRAQLLGAVNHFYFRWWRPISFRLWTINYLLLLLIALFINRKLQAHLGGVILCAVILSAFGVTIVFLNCFFAAIQPRFTLPMMEVLILSSMVLLGVIFRGMQKFLGTSRVGTNLFARPRWQQTNLTAFSITTWPILPSRSRYRLGFKS